MSIRKQWEMWHDVKICGDVTAGTEYGEKPLKDEWVAMKREWDGMSFGMKVEGKNVWI